MNCTELFVLLDVDDTIDWHRYFMSVVVVADHTVAEPPKHTMSAGGGGVVCVTACANRV